MHSALFLINALVAAHIRSTVASPPDAPVLRTAQATVAPDGDMVVQQSAQVSDNTRSVRADTPSVSSYLQTVVRGNTVRSSPDPEVKQEQAEEKESIDTLKKEAAETAEWLNGTAQQSSAALMQTAADEESKALRAMKVLDTLNEHEISQIEKGKQVLEDQIKAHPGDKALDKADKDKIQALDMLESRVRSNAKASRNKMKRAISQLQRGAHQMTMGAFMIHDAKLQREGMDDPNESHDSPEVQIKSEESEEVQTNADHNVYTDMVMDQ